MKKLILLILLCIATPSYAISGVYIGETANDIHIKIDNKITIPIMVIMNDYLNKNIDMFLWIANIKDTNKKDLPYRYIDSNFHWKISSAGTITPIATITKLASHFYNSFLTLNDIKGFSSFTLHFCFKEHKPFIFPMPDFIINLNKQAVCGSNNVILQ